ncbi:MAG: hypothetical protein ACOC6C_01415 [Verrucomicrobiota bacterium]
MEKKYKVRVFGKSGCEKCAVLNSRLDKVLSREQWQDFEKEYMDLETEEGLVGLCNAECINPQQIPAMMVTEIDPESGCYEPVHRKNPGEPDEICGNSRLYQYVGLQTDYSAEGTGVISPKMITHVMTEAMS